MMSSLQKPPPNTLNQSTLGIGAKVGDTDQESKFCLIKKGHFDADGLKYLDGT